MTGPPFSAMVAMSGGVDSSVAAALLKRAGWEVYGLHLLLPAPAAVAESRIASVEAVARRLAISVETRDARDAFERRVIRPFAGAYALGLTPNPCVTCNEAVKFKTLLAVALEKGCDAVATGHYAIAEEDPTRLRRGVDPRKEQSYFLHRLNRRVLHRAVFPLGEWTKDAVRRLAGAMGLSACAAPESREVCFIPDNDYRRFVESRADPRFRRRGAIVDLQGRVVGEHPGIHHYTVGQRHGLGISSPRPYYVKALDPSCNQVVVGRREDLFSAAAEAEGVHWLEGEPPEDGTEVLAQIRYRHKAAAGRLRVLSSSEIRVDFRESQWAVTPGQALVCYEGDRLLGGGWIRKACQGPSES